MAVLAVNKGVTVTTTMSKGASPWRGGGVPVSFVTGKHGSSRNSSSGVGFPGSRRSHGQRRAARLPEEPRAIMQEREAKVGGGAEAGV